jgi:ABC-type multidrug transport system ATPase subunit
MRVKASQEEKDIKVNELIRDMKLTRCQDTYIGNAMIKGISGGERKKTCIAVELIADLPVVVLDGKHYLFT